MRSFSLNLRISAAFAALTVVAAAPAQTLGGYLDLGVRNILDSDQNRFFDKAWTPSGQAIDFSKTIGLYYSADETELNAFARSGASIDSDFGHIKAVAHAKTSDEQGDALAALSVTQKDRFTIDQAGLTGTMGTFDARIRVHGIHAAQRFGGWGGVVSEWNVHYALSYDDGGATEGDAGAGGLELRGIREWTQNFNGTTGDDFDTYTVPVTFVYGTPIDLSLEFDLSAHAYGGGGSIVADLGHTVEWQGITNLRDANGNLVNAFTSGSNSGFNYGKIAAVPEPASVAAFAVGALGLLRRRRRG